MNRRRDASNGNSTSLPVARPSCFPKRNLPYWRTGILKSVPFTLLFILFLVIYAWLQMAATASADYPETNAQSESQLVVPPLPLATTSITFTTISDYLSNPGIGWQDANTIDNPILPEAIAYRRPQYNWRMQNPDENVFDWSAVDADLAAAEAQGKQFSFRIYTMRGESFGGHQIPQWVLDKGAVILSNGEPDYSNCVYQEEWAKFVEAMRQKYDGRPNIAFIDISGYGNFNEWSWQNQTQWEDDTLDAQARQRLADMFIGGQGEIQCRSASGSIETVTYDYPGFQETQLLMPYAGIKKSSEYVANRRPDVGIRHDCLGAAHANGMVDHIGHVVAETWPNAPIVYEFCAGSTADPDYIAAAADILKQTHGSIVHDNLVGERDVDVLTDILKFAGYRFTLDQVTYPDVATVGDNIEVSMTWRNTGYAPAYPKMGQDFQLHVYLLGPTDEVLQDWSIEADVASWLPAHPIGNTPPEYQVQQQLPLPNSLSSGVYSLKVAIIEKRTGRPINLAIAGRDNAGRYLLSEVTIDGEGSSTPQPTPPPSSEPTDTYLTIQTDQQEIYPGDPVTVNVAVNNAEELYGLQITCSVDPTTLTWTSAQFDDFFTDPIVGAKNLDAAAGTWTGAISQKNPAPALSGDGAFATFTFEAAAIGSAAISCDPLASDRDGVELPITVSSKTITVLDPSGATPGTPTEGNVVQGKVAYQGRSVHSGIEIKTIGPSNRSIQTDSTGEFVIEDLPDGDYGITVDAQLHLPTCTTSNVTSGQIITLSDALLAGGDLDDNNEVRINDATLVGSNFGLSSSTAPEMNPLADINVDGEVNVQDLSILGGNFGKSGCQEWTTGPTTAS